MNDVRRGRLADAASAPSRGEETQLVLTREGVVIEQILSGTIDEPVEYLQDHDEWFVVLAGSAELEVDERAVPLQTGDWMLLPRATRHRLLRTTTGTSWLVVRITSHAR